MKKIILSFLIFFSLPVLSSEKAVHIYKAEMSCMACAHNIKIGLEQLNKKVTKFNADPEKDIIKLSFEGDNKALSEEELKKLLKLSGYVLTPVKK